VLPLLFLDGFGVVLLSSSDLDDVVLPYFVHLCFLLRLLLLLLHPSSLIWPVSSQLLYAQGCVVAADPVSGGGISGLMCGGKGSTEVVVLCAWVILSGSNSRFSFHFMRGCFGGVLGGA
jgi:hypothetical protein